MKIAFLNMYSGVVNRGAETFVHEIAQRLTKHNEVTLFQFGDKRGRESYNVISIPMKINWSSKDMTGTIWRRLFIDYWSLLILLFTLKSIRKIIKEKFEIIVPLNGGWQPALIRIITWIYGGKMVISGQSGIGWDERNNLWCFPDCFVALSSYAKNWAKRVNPFVKTEYVPNGVDIQKFNQNGDKLKIDLKKPIILTVGALTPSKRIDLVVKAISKMKDASLLVVGDGEQRDELTRIGEGLMKNRFQLIKLPFEQMPKAYRTANLFTLVSESYYSFEIVLAEAMATNLPVVANDDPIRGEIVENAGILVDPTDTDTYAKALEKALQTDWGDKPRKQAEKFSWDKVVKMYENLFEDLIAQS